MSPIVANASEPLPVYSQPDTIAIPSPGAPVSVYILPTEIIEIICHYADFRKPGLHVGWKKSLKNKTVYATGSIAQRALICVSCPLTRSWFSKAAAIQVNTVSKDQGWCG